MAIQMVALVTVSRKACSRPATESGTAPIWVMPRFSIRSPALAQATIIRIIAKVLIRRRKSRFISSVYWGWGHSCSAIGQSCADLESGLRLVNSLGKIAGGAGCV